MKAVEQNFLKFLNTSNQFVVPIYQRKYSWTFRECQKLFNDIRKAGENNEIIGHFTGAIVYITKGIYQAAGVQKLNIIDGQQRMTTISLLLIALRDYINDNDIEIDIPIKKLNNYFLVNVNEEDDEYYKLKLTIDDNEIYKSLVDRKWNNDNFLKYNSENKLFNNYKKFYYDLSQIDDLNIIYRGLSKLLIIDVSLEQDKDNPQLIFESLNSTGLDLSQSDLIRNFVLMDLDIDYQNYIYREYWLEIENNFKSTNNGSFDRFSRDYLTIKNNGKIPNYDKIYDEFKIYFKSELQTKNLENIVKDFLYFSKIFITIADNSTNNIRINKILKNINDLKANVVYPFVMELLDDYNNEIVNEEDTIDILKAIETYIFRRAVVKIPTNSLNKTFATLKKQIDIENYKDSFLYYLLNLKGYRRFPHDNEFLESLKTRDIYNFQRIKFLLTRLENKNSKEIVDLDNYTIEHIMPQTLNTNWKEILGANWKKNHEEYLNNIGNLTLTKYNSEYSNDNFENKLNMENGFKDSPLRLNKMIAEYSSWDIENIKERADKLGEEAILLWEYPQMSKEYINNLEIQNEENYTINSYQFAEGEILELYYEIVNFMNELDNNIEISFNKHYVNFKYLDRNITSVIFYKEELVIYLNDKLEDIEDYKNIARDVKDIGHLATGDIEYRVKNKFDLDYLYYLIRQIYNKSFNFR